MVDNWQQLARNRSQVRQLRAAALPGRRSLVATRPRNNCSGAGEKTEWERGEHTQAGRPVRAPSDPDIILGWILLLEDLFAQLKTNFEKPLGLRKCGKKDSVHQCVRKILRKIRAPLQSKILANAQFFRNKIDALKGNVLYLWEYSDAHLMVTLHCKSVAFGPLSDWIGTVE